MKAVRFGVCAALFAALPAATAVGDGFMSGGPGSIEPPAVADVSDPGAAGSTASRVKFEQKLGARVPPGATFRDEDGREVRFSSLLGRRPIVLAMVYHRCPLLCNQVLQGLVRALKPLPLNAGVDFDVVAVSIDPDDTPESARAKKAGYTERYDRPGTEGGWNFLVGKKEAIDAVCDAIGFEYVKNPVNGQYAHAAGIVVLTPGGTAAQYLYGIDYSPKQLDAAIRGAGEGRTGSRVEQLLLLCYDYDSATGKYTLSIVRVLRVFGSLTALSLGLYLFLMFRRDFRAAAEGAAADDAAADPAAAGDAPGT